LIYRECFCALGF